LFEKSRAEAVINSLKDASIGIDNRQTILFANDQALQLLGLSTDELVGKSVADISKRNDLFRFLIEEGNSSPFKVVLANKENYFTKEVIAVNQKEGTENKVIVLKNITSFKELDVAKTNFIATISHELKTPLASSNFGIKLLEDERIGSLSAEQKGLIEQLKQDNQRMLKILSELLNLSQVETGRIEINLKDVDPTTIVESATSFVQSAATDKHITIDKNIEGSIPKVKADVEKTGWVLNNFLVNALKFSSPGSRIIVSAQKNNNNVVFTVTDFGPGIGEAFHEKIFDRYFKVPGSNSGGTGLGLAIAKDFISAMNGKIWVDSKEGQGSRFSFSLPCST
jgi:PAS domain S-box-containing protein